MSFIKWFKTCALQLLLVVTICTLSIVSFVLPASASESIQSQPRSSEAKLDKIYEKSEDALRDPPLSLDKVKEQANKGINEVQGGADAQKMKTPEDSQEATSVEEDIEQALDKVTNPFQKD